MRKAIAIGVVLLGGALLGLGTILVRASADYVQVSCEVTPAYAVIWIDSPAESARHAPLRFNVQFDPNGVVVRLPPQFYGPDWSQIEEIEMAYKGKLSESGELRLRIRDNPGGLDSVQTIGRVQRSCWNDVRSYIRGQVEAKGIAVRVSETITK